MWKRVILWILTVVWACGIFYFSAQPATESADVSGKVAKKIAQTISGEDASESEIEVVAKKIHSTVRKAAHFALYLVLGALLFLLCRSYGVCSVRGCLIALGVSVLYAAGDELHQFCVPGRSGQITDVLLDGFGTFVGILLVLACGWMRRTILIKKK